MKKSLNPNFRACWALMVQIRIKSIWVGPQIKKFESGWSGWFGKLEMEGWIRIFMQFHFFSSRCPLIFLHNFHLTSYFDLHHKWLQKYFLLFWYGLLLGPKYSTRVIERMSCEQNKIFIFMCVVKFSFWVQNYILLLHTNIKI